MWKEKKVANKNNAAVWGYRCVESWEKKKVGNKNDGIVLGYRGVESGKESGK